MKQLRPYPQVIVTKKAARALAGGHPWVFEGEVIRVEPSPESGERTQNGCIVDVFEENGTYQGTGLLSEISKIRVRIVTKPLWETALYQVLSPTPIAAALSSLRPMVFLA